MNRLWYDVGIAYFQINVSWSFIHFFFLYLLSFILIFLILVLKTFILSIGIWYIHAVLPVNSFAAGTGMHNLISLSLGGIHKPCGQPWSSSFFSKSPPYSKPYGVKWSPQRRGSGGGTVFHCGGHDFFLHFLPDRQRSLRLENIMFSSSKIVDFQCSLFIREK